MSDIRIRVASRTDLPRLTEIYNHYVVHTPVTFDVEPYSVERRAAWFDQFFESGRYRLLVFEAISTEDIHRILAGYVLPNPASAALHERFGFKLVGIFSENGRKLDRYWDVAWTERPLRV